MSDLSLIKAFTRTFLTVSVSASSPRECGGGVCGSESDGQTSTPNKNVAWCSCCIVRRQGGQHQSRVVAHHISYRSTSNLLYVMHTIHAHQLRHTFSPLTRAEGPQAAGKPVKYLARTARTSAQQQRRCCFCKRRRNDDVTTTQRRRSDDATTAVRCKKKDDGMNEGEGCSRHHACVYAFRAVVCRYVVVTFVDLAHHKCCSCCVALDTSTRVLQTCTRRCCCGD